ncbi:hypothetical protein ACWKWW_22465 [Chryseobacterium cucumeris]
MNRNYVFSLLSLFLLTLGNAQNYKKPLVSAIKESDLRTDKYQHPADQNWGRDAGGGGGGVFEVEK